MTDSSLARKRKKVTYTASTLGIERAEKALQRLGFESKSNFAESQLLSRSTVTKFFQCQPIQLDSFKRICKALKLNWAEVAGIIEEGQSEGLERINYSSPVTDEVVKVQTVHRQVTVVDKQTKKIKAVIVLEGDINSVNSDLKVSLELALRTYPGDTIKITDIQAGSIRLIVEGSQEDIERLVSRIQSGELTTISGFPVEDIQVLNETSDDEESDELNDKWHLVQQIVNHAVAGRNLRNADLSDADLSDAILRDADLRDSDLSDADLSGANLSDADLSGADLRGANLSGVFLMGTIVKNIRFGQNEGLSENVKLDLLRRGAIFEDSLDKNNEDTTKSDVPKSESQNQIVRRNSISVNFILANLIRGNLSGAFRILTNLNRAELSGADLSGADLSGANLSFAYLISANLSRADLSGADLISANLSFAYLISANLSAANLSGANLISANLSGANLISANLIGANLSGANLIGANLSGANVKNARFGNNQGISEPIKRDLIQKGAIFEDSPGDRSSILVPH